ncbi:MAG TPA: alkaline phosphatase, partial [Pirellulaceae bacterium]|nr:alkaline phosphatase [Pirellulaceae bacterium]
MTAAGITAIAARGKPFWMLVEAGDVDWANHDDNLDNSIGAVRSGDDAVRVVTEWVERHSDWNESLVIVTADHGHLLFLDDPKRLAELIGER